MGPLEEGAFGYGDDSNEDVEIETDKTDEGEGETDNALREVSDRRERSSGAPVTGVEREIDIVEVAEDESEGRDGEIDRR